MSKISDVFSNKKDFYKENGASTEAIENAEKKIGVKFANDYKDYLVNFGSVSCCGHELTGISIDRNLDVVNATLSNYKKNQNVKEPFYVIEETHIDGIVIWQTESGEIFQSDYKGKPMKIYNSLEEYVATFDD